MFCLIACVSAGAGDDNDATYPEVGIEWVVNYDWPSDDLPNADDDARGFYNTLGSNGWTKRFDYGDSSTQVYHWTYSNDLNYVDKVDAVYFSGHGAPTLIKLGTWPDRHVAFYDCSWGDYDLEWVFLHGCYTTYLPAAFKQSPHWALNGAHLISGFTTTAYNYAEDGGNVASRLVNSQKVRIAWYLGVDVKQPSGVNVRIIGEDSSMGDDYIWKEGIVMPDPTVDSDMYSWYYWCN